MKVLFCAVLVLGTSLPLSADEHEQKATSESQRAIREFNERGGWAYWAQKTDNHLIIRRKSKHEKHRIDLALLKPLLDVKRLTIHGTNFYDDDLNAISNWKHLEGLHLIYNQVSDDGLRHITGLSKLKRLILWDTKVTGKGLKHVANLTKLEDLEFQRNRMVVVELESLPHLKKLWLVEPRTTAVRLNKLPALRELDVHSTKITEENVKQLRQAFPKCDID